MGAYGRMRDFVMDNNQIICPSCNNDETEVKNCILCSGTGYLEKKVCHVCGGHGVETTKIDSTYSKFKYCVFCNGKGFVWA